MDISGQNDVRITKFNWSRINKDILVARWWMPGWSDKRACFNDRIRCAWSLCIVPDPIPGVYPLALQIEKEKQKNQKRE